MHCLTIHHHGHGDHHWNKHAHGGDGREDEGDAVVATPCSGGSSWEARGSNGSSGESGSGRKGDGGAAGWRGGRWRHGRRHWHGQRLDADGGGGADNGKQRDGAGRRFW
jgi:hypothetical protein